MVRIDQTKGSREPRVGPVLLEDLPDFASRLHPAEGCNDPLQLVAGSLMASERAVGLYLDDDLVGVVGFVERLEPPLVWFLSTETIWGYPLWLARAARPIFDSFGYTYLQAQIGDNPKLARFLCLWGFTPTDTPTIYEWRSDS